MGEFGENPDRPGKEGKTSKLIHNLKTGFKNLTKGVDTKQPNRRPTLEDQLKAEGMQHSVIDEAKPTLRKQIKDKKINKVGETFAEMGKVADELSEDLWNELDQEIYDEAIKQGKVEYAKKYRQDRLEDHTRYLKEKEKRSQK
ncbi:MAG: hypothetical protein Q7K55_03570 [Candidatus Levybacteria bacterium]|nr:hypothetical protein [Candidatus Levybacteria bacterium]